MGVLALAGVSARAMPKSQMSAWPLDSRMFSGLIVAVNDAVLVRVAQAFRDLPNEPDGLGNRQTTAMPPAPTVYEMRYRPASAEERRSASSSTRSTLGLVG